MKRLAEFTAYWIAGAFLGAEFGFVRALLIVGGIVCMAAGLAIICAWRKRRKPLVMRCALCGKTNIDASHALFGCDYDKR